MTSPGTYKDRISRAANRRLRRMLTAHILWLAVVCILGAWWGSLIYRQAERIAELERQTGLPEGEVARHWSRTHLMIYGESSVFFALLAAITALLVWMYWRDVRRARSLQAFFASVTHELRTPLTSIRLQAESLADSLMSSDEGQRALIDRLLQDTQRLESQVDRTLELARVEGGGPVLLQTVALKPWVDRLVRGWSETYGKRVEFRAELGDHAVQADPAALGVILRNLLENSLRHAGREPVVVSLSAARTPRGVEVLFRDNGKGFPGDLRYLGKVFHRGSESQGTGVGLYLVQALMDQMGGGVRLASEAGFFEVTLSFRPATAEGAVHD